MTIKTFEPLLYAANRRYPKLSVDEQHVYDIVQSVKRPAYQRHFVSSFIERHMGTFIAIHWRFDKRDWQHHCEVKEDNYYCELVTSVYSNITETKAAFKAWLTKTKAESKINALYFSAPTDELIIRHVVRETVFEDEDLLLFDQNDLQPLIEQWDCVHKDDSFDVLSSLEQEICYESEIFLFSKISSWSKNILYQVF